MFGCFGAKPFNGQRGEISALAISPDGSEAITGSYRHQFLVKEPIIWDLPSGRIVRSLQGHGVGVFSAAYSPDSNLIATGGGGVVKGKGWIYDHSIRLWNRHGESCGVFGENLFFVRALSFSPDSTLILSGSSNHASKAPEPNGASLRLWDASNHREVQRFGRHASAIHAVAFSPDGKKVVAGSSGMTADGFITGDESGRILKPEERTLRMWDMNTGAELPIFSYPGWINALAFHPNGKYLFSAGRRILCWDCETGKQLRCLGEEVDQRHWFHCAALSPDGKYLAVGTGGKEEAGAPFEDCYVRLFNSDTGIIVAEIPHKCPVNRLAFSPAGDHLLAGGGFGELHYWTVPPPA
jgi:WD40 repeat protein